MFDAADSLLTWTGLTLAAAAFIDDHGLTPYDAVHAGIAHVEGEQVLSTEGAYDDVGIDRVGLDGYADDGT